MDGILKPDLSKETKDSMRVCVELLQKVRQALKTNFLETFFSSQV